MLGKQCWVAIVHIEVLYDITDSWGAVSFRARGRYYKVGGGGGGGGGGVGRFLYSIKLYRTSVQGGEVIHRNARTNTSQMHDPTHLYTKMSLSIIISRGELRGNLVQVL